MPNHGKYLLMAKYNQNWFDLTKAEGYRRECFCIPEEQRLAQILPIPFI
jgi:hypothetical protein